MRQNRKKLNQSIMYGVMGMAIVVLLIVLLFWYLWVDNHAPAPLPE